MARSTFIGQCPVDEHIQDSNQTKSSFLYEMPTVRRQNMGRRPELLPMAENLPPRGSERAFVSSIKPQPSTENFSLDNHPSKTILPYYSHIDKTRRSFSSDPPCPVMQFTQTPTTRLDSTPGLSLKCGPREKVLGFPGNLYQAVATTMEMSASSSGFKCNDITDTNSLGSSNGDFLSTKVEDSMSAMEGSWPSCPASFYGYSTGSSPSSASSFDMMDAPTDNSLFFEQPLQDWADIESPAMQGLMSQIQDSQDVKSLCCGDKQVDGLPQCFQDLQILNWQGGWSPDSFLSQGPGGMPYDAAWSILNGNTDNHLDGQLFAMSHNHDSEQYAPLSHISSSAVLPSHHQYPQSELYFQSLISPEASSLPTAPVIPLSTSPVHQDHDAHGCEISAATEEDPTDKIQPHHLEDSNSGVNASIHYSDRRNAMLIKWKKAGLSYKDIKRIGGFKEAESTLRGRFRTLTKTKEQRVRKPKWLARDIELLCEAVVTMANQTSLSDKSPADLVQTRVALAVAGQLPKVSWKKVAQYIWANGGSYQFGNATCKKKWCDIHGIKI
ncbi:hypothetical protein N7539_008366 [Penicillium diatomitis]|uniref:Myb-like domain-containing protein n=1 Tax=Penicillium diatomitis TaxID=2819901 RepID=A0A9X0BN47_9EURO|nr:uncharacterized protein N7539_008366 [Penicillium diatomitis]KAJ5475300.1 hypothetical protein N7539_008366 [Penicillium diatomitis]